MTTARKSASIELFEIRHEPVKQLSGFQKHHRVPTSASNSDVAFVAGLAEPELNRDLDEVFSALRKAYGLKRREITVDGPVDGVGIIETPFFKYSIRVDLDPDQPSRVRWKRSIYEINEPSRIVAGAFGEVFGSRFHSLEVQLESPLDLEAIVDAIEDAESDRVSVDYDKDLTWCEIQLLDSVVAVKVSELRIELVSTRDTSPQELIAALVDVQQRFLTDLNLGRWD